MAFKSACPNDQQQRILKAVVHIIAKFFAAILRKLLRSARSLKQSSMFNFTKRMILENCRLFSLTLVPGIIVEKVITLSV